MRFGFSDSASHLTLAINSSVMAGQDAYKGQSPGTQQTTELTAMSAFLVMPLVSY